MNQKARKYVDLFRQVKIASAATVDEKGYPQSRIINVMIAADEGMYIVTSRGKPFYKQLIQTGRIALSAMCPDCQSLKFTGKVKRVDQKWVDRVFEENPGMNEVYPGKTRYALEAFLIYEGSGEWFDLLSYPINRESFAYNAKEEPAGFEIMETCIGCGACLSVCPQGCIKEGQPYEIAKNHCLQCGACQEACPEEAIRRIHP
ncbi:4Fe-4S binding protein [Anaerovorax odorimutans]|uniref:Ferredoxin n=1 Tax=Anaerovorax odorimutans TaxID=109327 RepID=A0ABT1RRN0_9FIRM|nr:4Fe-4S binding protein [Anaerovorax odorimutans]MCQ4637809.1 4Fe-4S binding protein [Anaerovorax odorimutans]